MVVQGVGTRSGHAAFLRCGLGCWGLGACIQWVPLPGCAPTCSQGGHVREGRGQVRAGELPSIPISPLCSFWWRSCADDLTLKYAHYGERPDCYLPSCLSNQSHELCCLEMVTRKCALCLHKTLAVLSQAIHMYE